MASPSRPIHLVVERSEGGRVLQIAIATTDSDVVSSGSFADAITQ